MQLTILNHKKLGVGLLFIVFSFLLPTFLTVDTFHVYEFLFTGLTTNNQAFILVAACALVSVNTIRGCPHYMGAFLVSESFEVTYKGRRQGWINPIALIVIIYFVYQMIPLIHNIHYDLGAPAFFLTIILMMLWFLNYSYVSTIKKLLILFFALAALQFLDVVPMLQGLPFGHGETSQDVKLAASLIHAESLLSGSMLVLFGVGIIISALLFLLVKDENRLLQINALKAQNQEMVTQMRMQEIETRSMQELHHLVHDLKTPLTSIQTFAFVASLQCQDEAHRETREALKYIEDSVDHMSNMISEILHQDFHGITTTGELLGAALAQLSSTAYADAVTSRNDIPDVVININQIRMTRAIINLANNAYQASQQDRAFLLQILVTEDRKGIDPMVKIQVIDNCAGIPPEHLSDIWTRGISTKGSSGLGLPFVHELVEQSDGTIQIDSTVGVGTTVTILLPIGEKEIER